MSDLVFYTPRTTAPDPYSPYWQGTAYGGYNKFNVHTDYPGCTLPNCTAYCEGRWMEIMNWTSTNIAKLNATYWYAHTSDGYPRGQTPKQGAIICWRNWTVDGDGNYLAEDAGHVGIVEKIFYDSNGNITSLGVGYSASGGAYFNYRTNINAPNYKYKTNSQLQGFIYLPAKAMRIDGDGLALLGNTDRKIFNQYIRRK